MGHDLAGQSRVRAPLRGSLRLQLYVMAAEIRIEDGFCKPGQGALNRGVDARVRFREIDRKRRRVEVFANIGR